MPRRRFLIRTGQTAATAGLIRLLVADRAWAGLAAGLAPGSAGDTTGVPPSIGVPPELETWLADAVERLEKSYPYAYALYTLDDNLTISANRSGLSVTRQGPREGVVLGVFSGAGFREEATSFVDQGGIDRAARRLIGSAPAVPARGESPDPGPPLRGTWIERGTEDPDATPLPDRVEAVRELRARLEKREPRLLSTSADVSTGTTTRLFVNRTRRLTQVLTRCGFNSFVLHPGAGAKGGTPGAYWLNRRGIGGLERTVPPEADLDLMIERAARLAGAGPPPSGPTTIITEPDITGVLAHESFGHGVEVDMFVKGRARAAEYLGRRVGSDMVRILDDPSKTGGNGFYHFDDEGFPATPTVIVENGIFRAGLTDMLSAKLMKLPRSANGRREAYDHKVYARMSNTFFAPGTQSLEELLAGVDQGVLLGRLQAGMEDPKGWGIQIVVQYGEEIKNGRLTGRAFSPVTLSGYVPDVLGSVDGAGSVFQMGAGTCGKGTRESVQVGMGGPHLRFKARIS